MSKAGLVATLVIPTLALAAASSAVMAHPHHGMGAMFRHADADNDGTITRDEYRAAREQFYARRDRNGDGYIDDADVSERRTKRFRAEEHAATMRKRADMDNDGRISPSEFVDGAMTRFDKSDTDGNGVLDAKEIETSRAAVKQRMRKLRERRTQQAR